MADSALVDSLRSSFAQMGRGNKERLLGAKILDTSADDAFAVFCALELYAPFIEPVDAPESWMGLARGDGRALLDRALAAADAILAKPTRETDDERLLFCTRGLLRALNVVLERPSPADLVIAGAELDAVVAEYGSPDMGDPARRRFAMGRLRATIVRRRVWDMLAARAPYAGPARDQLINQLSKDAASIRWPLEPLVADPAFDAHVRAELAAHIATGAHPVPTEEGRKLAANSIATPLDPDLRALRFALSLGADAVLVGHVGRAMLRDSPPMHALEFLLSLGMGLEDKDESGRTMLDVAVEWGNVDAAQLFVKAGANTKNALALAKKNKHKALLAVLSATSSEPSPQQIAFATELRAAAAAFPAADLSWVGEYFAVKSPDPVVAIERLLQQRPASMDEALSSATGTAFERYVVARVVRTMGHRPALTIAAGDIDNGLTTSGDLTVTGTYGDNVGTLVVAGNLTIDGLLTHNDLLVGGDLKVTELLWADGPVGSLLVEGRLDAPLAAVIDHVVEARGEVAIGHTIEEADAEGVDKLFVKTALSDGALDLDKAMKLAVKGKPILKSKR